jgi:superfamily II DNA/RNA helicase
VSHTFADLGVPAELSRLLKNRGITEPFPIQSATVPDALAGRDICGKAPTGSGKTLAFGLAIATRTAATKAAPRRPRALVLVPTRELAAQVAGEIAALQTRRGQHVVAVYGGAGYGPQRKALAAGVTTVVACPGRLEDLLSQGDVRLDQVEVVVLDEADRMADMGFVPAVRRILDQTSDRRQTLLFSATLDGEVDALVRRYQHDPARHEVVPTDDEVGEVAHHFWRTAGPLRAGLTATIVRRHGRAIVFCRTKRGADRLARQLGAAGVDAAAIHGNRSQAQRERALAAFASGRVSALVATDVAARGIHVDDVPCVVHFDLPDDPKDYVHRSGRTGRAGASGTVVSLVPDEHRKTAQALQRTLNLPQSVTAPDLDDAPPAVANAPAVGSPADPVPPKARSDGWDQRFTPAESRRNRTSSRFRRSRKANGVPRPDHGRSESADRPGEPTSSRRPGKLDHPAEGRDRPRRSRAAGSGRPKGQRSSSANGNGNGRAVTAVAGKGKSARSKRRNGTRATSSRGQR